jgi:lipoprotein-anchoring transpeptidase ErfK/SrfK
VKLLALTFLIIGNLVANQAYADDVSSQPLTPVDCDKAEMAWDENANVCIANSEEVSSQPLTRSDRDRAGMSWNDDAHVCGSEFQAAATMLKSEETETLSQPLTRGECDIAGMPWNDKANVCGEKSEGSATQAASKETNPAASTVLINIDKTSQRMTVFLDGEERYDWPVSTGRAGYSTPSGTFTPTSMNEIWYSKQWDNSPMPHSIFFMKDGHAIHGSHEVKNLGKPASHGCVRISPQNAATLYALIAKNGLKNTQVVLGGLTPGGEGKVARSAKSPRSFKPGNNYYAESDAQPQRRGGFFRRLFGGR